MDNTKQNKREYLEIQKILSPYLSKEILKWQLNLTDEFYKEFFRLWNLQFTSENIMTNSSFVKSITLECIYKPLCNTALEEIKENNVCKFKFSDTKSKDVIKKRIYEVMTLLSVSDDKDKFIDLFEKKYHFRLDFTNEFNKKSEELSEFNKNLKKCLNFLKP